MEKKNSTKLSISYKFSENNDFKDGELIVFNKYCYFAELLDENKLKIKHKFKINTIYLFQDKNINEEENNLINFLIYENPLFNKGNLNDEKKVNIFVKFEDEKTKEKVSKSINDKIFSLNNDERLAFIGYLEEINNTIKNNEEDF